MENSNRGIITINRKLYAVIIGGAILFLLVLLILLLAPLFSRNKQPSTPSSTLPTPTPISVGGSYVKSKSQLTPLQKTQIDKTTENTVRKTLSILSMKKLSDGSTRYSIPSAQPGFSDEIITDNGHVVSEITLTQTSAYGDLPRIADYERLFGKPEKIIQGNIAFGGYADAHIYAKQGVMFVVNRFTGEVYRVQRFEPLSLAAYEKKYASYIESAPVPNDALQ